MTSRMYNNNTDQQHVSIYFTLKYYFNLERSTKSNLSQTKFQMALTRDDAYGWEKQKQRTNVTSTEDDQCPFSVSRHPRRRPLTPSCEKKQDPPRNLSSSGRACGLRNHPPPSIYSRFIWVLSFPRESYDSVCIYIYIYACVTSPAISVYFIPYSYTFFYIYILLPSFTEKFY